MYKKIKKVLQAFRLSLFCDHQKFFSALSLSELAVDLLVFQEKNFGRGCQERMQGMLIPVSCFYDFTKSGGFATIITNVRQFCLKESMPLKELQINRPENTSRGIQVFKLIRRSLKQKNKKVIYLSKEFDQNRRTQLVGMAESVGVTVVETRDQATHQVHFCKEKTR